MSVKISRFAIRGLYDERDIEIPFEDEVKILVAENGYGKTTVLNALYGVMSGNLSKLRKINFNSIEIDFEDGENFVLEKRDLDFSSSIVRKHGFYDHLKRQLGEDRLTSFLESYINLPEPTFKRSQIFQLARKKIDIPTGALLNFLNEITNQNEDNPDLSKAKEVLGRITSKIDYKFAYLPTYRRVEQDFRSIGIQTDEENIIYDDSINFGMVDVDRQIKKITKEILSSSVEWFSKVNGQMLSQLVDGFKVDEDLKSNFINPDAIKIVLDRIGNNINERYKEKILSMVESGDILRDHDALIYFISNLTKVYEQQKENDKAIQDFTSVCNKYLNDKALIYNESNVTVDIVRRKNGRPVDIETLSSGEKQIISLFSTLYLQKETNLAIFFDEPELSLSIEWQKTFLPDILSSGRCNFLFATTHSPFVFANDLAEKTVDLAEYITEL